MANYPQFNDFSLNDINETGVITSRIRQYQVPQRQIETQEISRRPGTRIMNDEYRNKIIAIEGSVFGNDPTDLRNKIDTLHQNVSFISEGQVAIASNRIGTAILQNLSFDENAYNQSYVGYSMELLMTDPFLYDDQHSVQITIASGITSHSETLTISGSYYALPTITLTVDGSSGTTGTQRVQFSYNATGETVVWSGGAGEENLNYGDILQLDYNTQLILRNSQFQNTSGAFAEFDPGDQSLTITFSGAGDWIGGTLGISYQPRYL